MNKHLIIKVFIAVVFLIIVIALLQIQVFNKHYAVEARNNIIQKLELQSVRGLILSQSGKILVNNQPIFNLSLVPRLFPLDKKTAFCELLQLSDSLFDQKFAKAKRYSRLKPSVILADQEASFINSIIDKLSNFAGVNIQPKFIRHYPQAYLAHTLGYIGQIGSHDLKKDSSEYYGVEDLVGKSGLEYYYESILRGKKGSHYIIKDVNNIIKKRFQNGAFDKPLQEGFPIQTSIDLHLQMYADSLMKGFKGAIVVLDPQSGGILTLVSTPNYPPSFLAGSSHRNSHNYHILQQQPNLPLFNRAIMARYPPGSTLKPILALISLAEGRLDTTRYYRCNRNLVACHTHPTPVNLKDALRYSCNPYFYQVLREFVISDRKKNIILQSRQGLDNFRKGLQKFGLDQPLGVDLPFEASSILPSVALYDRVYNNKRWKYNNYYSLAIGQGEIALTPLQLANIAAILANRGWYRKPHLVTHINSKATPRQPKYQIPIDSPYFAFVAKAMSKVVQGTARLAYIPNLILAGKTGTAQNPHGKDHSIFIAFAPFEKPKIAIAVYVENAGFGGSVAAPIASLIIERYLRGQVSRSRKWLKNYIERKKILIKADSSSLTSTAQ